MTAGKHRVAALAAVAGIAVAFGGATAPAAFADGPGTPPEVAAAIEAQPWVKLHEGDRQYRVLAVGAILAQTGHFDKEPIVTFDADLTAAVEGYQGDRGLTVTGVVDAATWDQLSDDVGTVRTGDPRYAMINGLEHSLSHLGYDVEVNGSYDANTVRAVEEFQRDKGIGVDGIIGPVTFHAMYAEGAEGGA